MLRFLGLAFAAILVAAGILFGLLYRQDLRASEYVAVAAKAIYRDWKYDELKNRAYSQLAQNQDFLTAGRSMFVSMGRVLGPMKSADPPQGQVSYGWGAEAQLKGVYGEYTVHARFEKGEADLRFVVVKQDAVWRIAGFRVDSAAFLEALEKGAAGPGSGG